jgi:hypothetical protein
MAKQPLHRTLFGCTVNQFELRVGWVFLHGLLQLAQTLRDFVVLQQTFAFIELHVAGTTRQSHGPKQNEQAQAPASMQAQDHP